MRRYTLAPAAARDLVEIWRYIKKESSQNTAERVETVIREKIVLLAGEPRAGHLRRDLTSADVRFFPVYSYLIVYRPGTKPLQIVAILHGARDVAQAVTATIALNQRVWLSPAILQKAGLSEIRQTESLQRIHSTGMQLVTSGIA